MCIVGAGLIAVVEGRGLLVVWELPHESAGVLASGRQP